VAADDTLEEACPLRLPRMAEGVLGTFAEVHHLRLYGLCNGR
jgi:hypothetical protein